MKMRKLNVLFVLGVLAISTNVFAGAEGKGGGDTVTCGNNAGEAAELFDLEHSKGWKKLAPFMLAHDLQDGVIDWAVEAIIDSVISVAPNVGNDLKNIRSQLSFVPVDKFSEQDIVDTGYKPSFYDRRFKNCKTVYTAYQDFEKSEIQVLSGGPFPPNSCPQNWFCPTPYIPPGYVYLSPLSRTLVQFHEIVLHRNWEHNKQLSIIELEAMTRHEIESYFVKDGFLKAVSDNYDKISVASSTACNKSPGVDGLIICIVAKWAGVKENSIGLSDTIQDIWKMGKGATTLTGTPTHKDLDELTKMLNEGIGAETFQPTDLYDIGPRGTMKWIELVVLS